MKIPSLEVCPHHVSLCTGIRSSKYKCLTNVLFILITKSLNKLYIGLFVARSPNSLETDNFLESILFNFFLEIQTVLAKIPWNNRKIARFYPKSSQELLSPLFPQSMLKKLADNTSGSFVNTLCNIEMRAWGELKVIFQFSLAKLICSNIFGQDCLNFG